MVLENFRNFCKKAEGSISLFASIIEKPKWYPALGQLYIFHRNFWPYLSTGKNVTKALTLQLFARELHGMVLNGRSNNMLPFTLVVASNPNRAILSDSVPLPVKKFIWSTFQTFQLLWRVLHPPPLAMRLSSSNPPGFHAE